MKLLLESAVVSIIIGILAGAIVVFCVKVVPPGKGGAVVSWSRPTGRNVGPGIYILFPWQKIVTIDTRLDRIDPPIEGLITKDGVPVKANPTWFRQVTNPTKALFAVKNPDTAIAAAVQMKLFDLVSDHTSTELTEDPAVMDELTRVLAEEVSKFAQVAGANVPQFGLQNFVLPEDISKARQQVRAAEQEKTARITRAQGEAEATKIVMDTQGAAYVQIETLDALRDMAQSGASPIVFLGQQPAGGDAQTGMMARMMQVLDKILAALTIQEKEDK